MEPENWSASIPAELSVQSWWRVDHGDFVRLLLVRGIFSAVLYAFAGRGGVTLGRSGVRTDTALTTYTGPRRTGRALLLWRPAPPVLSYLLSSGACDGPRMPLCLISALHTFHVAIPLARMWLQNESEVLKNFSLTAMLWGLQQYSFETVVHSHVLIYPYVNVRIM